MSSPELGPGDPLVTLTNLEELMWGPVGSKALGKQHRVVERRRLCARTAAQRAPPISVPKLPG